MADERGPRILLDVNNAFVHDPSIDEYDFLPVLEPEQNKSPVLVTEHKLGIEAWAVKILYQYAYCQLMKCRVQSSSQQKISTSDMAKLSRVVLLINPECATVWNTRKELLIISELNADEELKFVSLVLTRNPKSAESFAHRKWVLLHHEKVLVESVEQNVFDVNGVLGTTAQIGDELDVCEAAAAKYANNYHAWSHRIWVLQHLVTCKNHQLLYKELDRTETFVNRHVSDHSGYHYRQFLISSLQDSVDYTDILHRELVFTTDLITSYPGHESAWCHRRFVVHFLLGCCHGNQNAVRQPNQVHKRLRKGPDQQSFISDETEFAEKMMTTGGRQEHLSRCHIQWLKRCCSLG